MPGRLFVVATPIGNLDDFSPRAVATLQEVDLIACEDTRHTRKLLNHFGIDTPTTSFHEHNEGSMTPGLIARLLEGQQVALVSDAGTPLLSDPGYRLVSSGRKEGIPIVPIPGPFAGAAAVSVSGLPTDQVLFLGFLPRKKGAMKQTLDRFAHLTASLVIYLSPHQLIKTLEVIENCLGDRQVFLIREMTKLYETGYSGRLSQIREQLEKNQTRGEYTIVIAGALESEEYREQLDIGAYVMGLMQKFGISSKEAIRLAVDHLAKPKREVYQAYIDTRRS